MATTVRIPWTTGSGDIIVTYTGSGDGTIVVTSDDNNLAQERQQTLTVSGGGISRQVTVIQGGKPTSNPNFILSDGKYLLLSDNKYFNVQIENG